MLSIVIAAAVIMVALLLAAVMIYRKRKRSAFCKDGDGKDSEKGSILLGSERGDSRKRSFRYRDI